MTPDEAKFLATTTLKQIRKEWDITRKVLKAVPEDNLQYQPDPKARTAIELCWHIVMTDLWFMESIVAGEFSMEEPQRPDDVKIPTDVIRWYEERSPEWLEKLEGLGGERYAAPTSFFGMFDYPAVMYLHFAVVHAVHHRAQLSVYLRPMGSKIPSIYGGSADEPFEMPKA